MAEDKQISAVTEPQAAPPSPETVSGLRDKRVRPEGVVPKQAQGYVVAGLAVLILMAVMFSKNHAKPASKDAPLPPPAMSTDMNQRKIQELEQDLSADQRQSQQQALAQRAGAGASPVGNTVPATNTTPVAAAPVSQPTEPPRDPVADAERALVFRARFASNLVSANDAASRPLAESTDRPESMAAPTAARPTEPPQQSPVSQVAAAKRAPEVNVNSAHGQPYVVFEGTTIDTALVNRLDGEFAGPVKVLVTNPVYSQDRQHVLIPEGTFILGDTQKVSGFGQKRLAVTFHRLIMPDGYSVDLDQFRGLDQAGETGINGKVNNHYLEIFGASIALGIISGAAQATINSGYNANGSDVYRQGLASSLAASGTNVLDRFINIPPTITPKEGRRIEVYLTQDMLLPAYENHTVPGDI
jgi:type IV secretory pathway VirB10-like protein